MEPYKKSGFAAPKSLRSPEQPEALSPEEGETADSRCTSLTKVWFLGIDCCLNGPLVHCFDIPTANVQLNSLQKTIYQSSSASWVIKVSWLIDNCLSWICSIEHIPAKMWLLLTWTLPLNVYSYIRLILFLSLQKTIYQSSSASWVIKVSWLIDNCLSWMTDR